MPWKETCQMDERTQFIARVLAGEAEMTALYREYGISRKTGYKWFGRYRCEGAAGLRERSHAPLRHGQAHDVAVVQAVLELRERWGWGAKKLRVKLGERHPELVVPAASTIGDWLRREGLVGRARRRRRCPAYAQPFAAVAAANDVWCTDFKRCYGASGEDKARSSLETTDRICPMPRPNDVSRSLAALDQDSTLIAVVEISQSSWLVAGIVPGIDRQPVKKLAADETALLQLLYRWRSAA